MNEVLTPNGQPITYPEGFCQGCGEKLDPVSIALGYFVCLSCTKDLRCTCESFTTLDDGTEFVYKMCSFCIDKLKEEQKEILGLPF